MKEIGTEIEVGGKWLASVILKFYPWLVNYNQENM